MCLLSAAFQPKGVLMKHSMSVPLDPDMTSKFTITIPGPCFNFPISKLANYLFFQMVSSK